MWCLSEVDYGYVDLKTYLYLQPELAQTNKVKDDERSTRGLKSLVTPARSSHNNNGISSPETALSQLREALLFQDPKTNTVSSIIANWPIPTLRLSDVLRPEEVRHRIGHEEQLWSWIFQGIASRTTRCKMTTLDLTKYKPGDGLVYLLTGVVPLLALPPEERNISSLMLQIKTYLTIDNPGLTGAIESYLKVLLNHKLFQKDRRMVIPEDLKLEIIFDFFPISRQRLAHLSFLTSTGLSRMTRVFISCKSAIVSLTATNGNSIPPDDSLQILKYYTAYQKHLSGLYFDGVCEDDHLKRVSDILENNRHLVSVGISSSHSSMFRLGSSPSFTASVFQKMSALTRLELRELDLTGELERLLSHLPESIAYFGIPSCRLSLGDIKSCYDCTRRNLVKEFNMSNVLIPDISDYSDSSLSPTMSHLFRMMENVVVLNLLGAPLIASRWNEFLEQVSLLTNLQILILDKIPVSHSQVNELLDLCLLKLLNLRKLVLTHYYDRLYENENRELLGKIENISQSTKIDITAICCKQ